MRQWKCKSCGSWVSMAHLKHYHVQAPTEPTTLEIIQWREQGNDGFPPPQCESTWEIWTPQHETREKPLP